MYSSIFAGWVLGDSSFTEIGYKNNEERFIAPSLICGAHSLLQAPFFLVFPCLFFVSVCYVSISENTNTDICFHVLFIVFSGLSVSCIYCQNHQFSVFSTFETGGSIILFILLNYYCIHIFVLFVFALE